MERTLGLIMVWLATIFFMLSFAAVTLLGAMLVGKIIIVELAAFLFGGDDSAFKFIEGE